VWALTDAGEKASEKDLLLIPKKVRWLKKEETPAAEKKWPGHRGEPGARLARADAIRSFDNET
jgi:hypothetical protein